MIIKKLKMTILNRDYFEFIIMLFCGVCLITCVFGYVPVQQRVVLQGNMVPIEIPVKRFLQSSSFLNGKTFTVDNPKRRGIINWICKNLNIKERDINEKNFPLLVAASIRGMYSSASLEQNNEVNIYEHIIANPAYSAWSYCDQARSLMHNILSEFEYGVIGILLFNGKKSHSVLMYEDRAFQQWTYCDPVYGVYLINDQGKPATVFDILEQLNHFPYGKDFNEEKLSFKSYRIFDYYPFVSKEKNMEYKEFDIPYKHVMKNYFDIICLRYEDLSHLGMQLSGFDIERGRWIVFDNSNYSDVRDSYDKEYWDWFHKKFNRTHNGRYFLTIYKSS